MQITPSTAVLEIGQSVTLTAVPAQSGQKWSSKTPAVVTVNSSGVVTGVSAGSATIIVKKGNQQAAATVIVNAAATIPEPPQPQPPEPTPIPPEPIPPSIIPSPNGTEVPPASTIIDASGARWTFGPSVPEAPGHRYINRNGVFTEGYGSSLLYYGQQVYTFGGDGNWWVHDGQHWQTYGPTKPGSAPPVEVPPPVIEIPPSTLVRFVSITTGRDDGPGTESDPYKTLTRGSQDLGPDSLLYVRGGDYPESLVDKLPPGESWTRPVRVMAYNAEPVWLRPPDASHPFCVRFLDEMQYVHLRGLSYDGRNVAHDAIKFDVRSCDSGRNPEHIRIEDGEIIAATESASGSYHQCVQLTGCLSDGGFHEFRRLKFHGGREHGVYCQTADNIFEDCEFWDIPKAGIQIYNGYDWTRASRNVIRRCIFRDCTRQGSTVTADRGWGIVIYAGRGNQAIGNLIYAINRWDGLEPYGINAAYTEDAEIISNTVADGAGTGILIESTARRTRVSQNISWGNRVNYQNDAGDTINDGSNVFAIDPLFVNPAARDYHLQSGSPAIGPPRIGAL